VKSVVKRFLILATSGIVTVPHPKKDLPVGTARAILKSAGIHQS
jgi:predicted RNA binding protein YcfA (HicA-like mRNA interferase family)